MLQVLLKERCEARCPIWIMSYEYDRFLSPYSLMARTGLLQIRSPHREVAHATGGHCVTALKSAKRLEVAPELCQCNLEMPTDVAVWENSDCVARAARICQAKRRGWGC